MIILTKDQFDIISKTPLKPELSVIKNCLKELRKTGLKTPKLNSTTMEIQNYWDGLEFKSYPLYIRWNYKSAINLYYFKRLQGVGYSSMIALKKKLDR